MRPQGLAHGAAVQILRIVETRDEGDHTPACKLAIETVQVAQRGEVVERESHRIEDRHVRGSEPAGQLARDDVGELDDTRTGVELLNLALDVQPAWLVKLCPA